MQDQLYTKLQPQPALQNGLSLLATLLSLLSGPTATKEIYS